MYAQFASEIARAESAYKTETMRRALKPSRRRDRAMYDSETRTMTQSHARKR